MEGDVNEGRGSGSEDGVRAEDGGGVEAVMMGAGRRCLEVGVLVGLHHPLAAGI